MEESSLQNYYETNQDIINECLNEAIKWLNVVNSEISKHSTLISLENLKMNKFFARCYMM